MQKYILEIAKKAKEASRILAQLSTQKKNDILISMADSLLASSNSIIKANQKDISFGKRKKLSGALIDRLRLDKKRIQSMAESLEVVAKLKDPVKELIKKWRTKNGLLIKKVRVPIGVIGIIYESRPNVTSDCVGLCLKSGNSVILRGGSEAINSNLEIFKALNKAIKKFGLPEGSINIVGTTAKKAVDELLKLDGYIDLIIPRGGEALIKKVAQNSRIPVIKHYKGICHTYVDKFANLEMAQKICFNAKVERPGVCNAMETLLAHKDIAGKFLPSLAEELAAANVEIRGCPETVKILKGLKGIKKARLEDWGAEYLDLILSVKVVSDIDEAIDHITKFGSDHSDAIITEEGSNARKFLENVDSACVFLNASTRFTDGYEFGMGAEIGISTDKLHARGPMALEELTTYKYQIIGRGQTRTS